MAWCRFYDARSFDAEDARELDGAYGCAAVAPGEELGVVETEGFDAEEDLAGLRGWDWEGGEVEVGGWAGGFENDCSHRFRG